MLDAADSLADTDDHVSLKPQRGSGGMGRLPDFHGIDDLLSDVQKEALDRQRLEDAEALGLDRDEMDRRRHNETLGDGSAGEEPANRTARPDESAWETVADFIKT